MRIYYSKDEASIKGEPKEFFELYKKLNEFTRLSSSLLAIDAEDFFNPAPYDSILSKIIFKKSEGALDIKVENSTLYVDGSHSNLVLFAKNLPYNVDASQSEVPYHVHFDHISWPNEITSNSIELILECLFEKRYVDII